MHVKRINRIINKFITRIEDSSPKIRLVKYEGTRELYDTEYYIFYVQAYNCDGRKFFFYKSYALTLLEDVRACIEVINYDVEAFEAGLNA